MLLEIAADPATSTMMSVLLEQYGVIGLVAGGLLALIIRQSKSSQKRVEALEGRLDSQHLAHETQQQTQHMAHLSDQKDTIEEYVELVKTNSRVLSDLTGCIKAIKGTLDRMERSK